MLQIRGPPVSARKGKGEHFGCSPSMRAWRNWKTHQLWKLALDRIAGSNPAARTIV